MDRLRTRRSLGRNLRGPEPELLLERRDGFDRAISWGVIGLVVATPFAMGAVHPWAFISIELAAFALAIIWMAKLWFRPPILHQPDYVHGVAIAIPLAAFIAYLAFQLLPLPPVAIHLLSPGTYRFYEHTLTGWPHTAPYRAMLEMPQTAAAGGQVLLPTPKEVEEGKRVPEPPRVVKPVWAAHAGDAPRWLPLSLETPMTRQICLKFAAYGALFFVVMLYPFGPSRNGEAEKRFCRNLLIAMLLTGLAVAFIGILERVVWNGKVLWIFVPYDWGRAEPSLIDRARGPFVNPDHFGAYLNLVLPIAVTGVLFPTFIARRNSEAFRVFCAAVTIAISVGLLLSLSRAGWFGAVLGVAILIFLASWIPEAQRPALLRLSWHVTVPLCAIAFAIVLATSSAFLGQQGRREADLRLQETISEHQSLGFRLNLWHDALPMVRDFSLFGSGVGAFGDLFPHYQVAPTPLNPAGEAHNDYLELLIGGGLLGFGLLVWFFAAVGVRLYRGLRALPPEVLPVAAALLAAMGVMGFQELVDFNLQIPANAVLFTILFAMVTRLIATRRIEERDSLPVPERTRTIAGVVSAAAALLAISSLGQGRIPYPYNLRQPTNPLLARDLVLQHPASVTPHVWMVEAMGPRLDREVRAHELATAAWLEPTNPAVLDMYAQSLVWTGREREGLDQITRSVFTSPQLRTHFYLQWRLIPWLLPEERTAVEKGFQGAVSRDFTGAVWSFGSYYEALQEYRKEAELFTGAAAKDRTFWKIHLLLAAGDAYARAGNLVEAEKALKQAAVLSPGDSHAYADLAKLVYGPQGNMPAAKAIIDRGVANGAEPFTLYMALADTAYFAKDQPTEESALTAAIDSRPSDYDAPRRLAELYITEGRNDRAVQWMRTANKIRDDDPWAVFELACAEEASYDYQAADRDFARAVELAPGNETFKARYADFQKKSGGSGVHDTSANPQ